MNNPQALGVSYEQVVKIVEGISRQTGIIDGKNLEPLIRAMGGTIARVSQEEWDRKNAVSVHVKSKGLFKVYLPKIASPLDQLLLATALGHYFLHSREGSSESKFYRFAKDATSLEGLWFGMAIVIPDESFKIAAANGTTIEKLAFVFSQPTQLIELKKKLLSAAERKNVKPLEVAGHRA